MTMKQSERIRQKAWAAYEKATAPAWAAYRKAKKRAAKLEAKGK